MSVGFDTRHLHNFKCELRGWFEKFSTKPTTDVKLGISGPLGRDPYRSWCHLHTSVKLFWSQLMDSWTSKVFLNGSKEKVGK